MALDRFSEVERSAVLSIAAVVAVLTYHQTSIAGTSQLLTAALAGGVALVAATGGLLVLKRRS